MNIPLFTGLYTFQVVRRISLINSITMDHESSWVSGPVNLYPFGIHGTGAIWDSDAGWPKTRDSVGAG